ncbi:MAG: Cytochrome b561 transmembrane protein [uncultured bacterium]|nr:MAG: Cytochrome b561 transmembrane protein [uncultured bacterium]
MLKNTQKRYGSLAIFLHWSVAIIVIFLLVIGLYMVRLPVNIEKLKLYRWHKEWGVLVFLLMVFRLCWRLINITPVLTLPLWQKIAARTVHFAFYIFLFVIPVTGWCLSSAAGLPISFFGLFTLPDLIAPNEHLRLLFTELHQWLSYGLIAAIGLHTGAALQHHFIYKDKILERMFP